jgi:phosphoglycerate dehydrogenase-like enzyme
VRIANARGIHGPHMSEFALALLLALAKRIPHALEQQRAHVWKPYGMAQLEGRTLGILGLGAIGRAVARRARGFGMTVLAWSRHPPREEGVLPVELPELLRRSDFVSVHLPLTPETRNLLDAAALRSMRPGAVLVNTARGGIVDESALADALREGRLAAAGLDVFEAEPLPPGSPLLALENVVVTPHIGSASIATRERMADLAVENLLAGLAGRRMPQCANPEVYAPQRARN